MLLIGQTLRITLNGTSSRIHTLSCLAKHSFRCVRYCFWQKTRRGFRGPLYANLPASTPESTRAFSASTQVVEGLFARSSLQDYLRKLEQEYVESVQRLSSTQASPEEEEEEEERAKVLRRRVTELAPVVTELQQLRLKMQELQDIASLLKDEDIDLKKLAESEESSCLETIRALKSKIISLVVPPEDADDNDLILEVTAGVGGQESMLFTAEMFEMYRGYAAFKNWHFEVLEYCHSDLGGLRHATASVSGRESYKQMKYEGGVHRVQRVPKTEKQGRTHTSTMTVAILPQPTEIDMTINPKDLRIETKRASGAGGQHVNTTDSAVRILHIPTGVVAECQQERSQLKNREKTMQMLRAKLYSMKLEEQTNKRHYARKIQVGTKGRSEKIRTYNFPQDRVTDHRIGKSLYDLRSFMMGEELLDDMVEELKGLADTDSLLELLEQSTSSQQNEHRHQ
ncbi:peptide chain release factor 1-like, mitochondrial [Carcharodon carcharias]|uniref:peptide chain release factor 1-like, mitochondrial n=1 Tax=Carcharodon carcharias TaxID=13397 RepID=UPI001B7F1B65|nr:peptide chain release factor 1-like, mitochondrial [Carcharodon carcharias]XP_041064356.1 peptide chain release factor 1-like, mitochondrial [Carcharodon carcharias]